MIDDSCVSKAPGISAPNPNEIPARIAMLKAIRLTILGVSRIKTASRESWMDTRRFRWWDTSPSSPVISERRTLRSAVLLAPAVSTSSQSNPVTSTVPRPVPAIRYRVPAVTE